MFGQILQTQQASLELTYNLSGTEAYPRMFFVYQDK